MRTNTQVSVIPTQLFPDHARLAKFEEGKAQEMAQEMGSRQKRRTWDLLQVMAWPLSHHLQSGAKPAQIFQPPDLQPRAPAPQQTFNLAFDWELFLQEGQQSAMGSWNRSLEPRWKCHLKQFPSEDMHTGHGHAHWSWTCTLAMAMHTGHGHAYWSWTCTLVMAMHTGHGHAHWSWTCILSSGGDGPWKVPETHQVAQQGPNEL
eukprot:1158183-Pelagomonas_calceolata.AAC.2